MQAVPHLQNLQECPTLVSEHLCSTTQVDVADPRLSGSDVLPTELWERWIAPGEGTIKLENATIFGT